MPNFRVIMSDFYTFSIENITFINKFPNLLISESKNT